MPAQRLSFFDLLAPRYVGGFQLPGHIYRYLSGLGVDELRTHADDLSVLYAGTASFADDGSGSPEVVHEEPGGGRFSWGRANIHFRLQIPRDGAAFINDLLNPAGGTPPTDGQLPQVRALLDDLRPVEQNMGGVLVATDYPAVAYRLELLLDVLHFTLGSEWKAGTIDPANNRVIVDPARSAERVKIKGLPTRQVPQYLFLETSADLSSAAGGFLAAGAEVGFDGTLSFYDSQGYPIHPLAVASLAKLLIEKYPVLNLDATLPNQLDAIIGLEASPSTTVRLVNPDGMPYGGAHLEGITGLHPEAGLFRVNDYAGPDAALKGEIKRAADTGDAGAFPRQQARQLLVSLVTYGRLSDRVLLVRLPDPDGDGTPNALAHDFFTVRVVDLQPALLGTPDPAFDGTRLEPRPAVRLHEQFVALVSGNAIMAGSGGSLPALPPKACAWPPPLIPPCPCLPTRPTPNGRCFRPHPPAWPPKRPLFRPT